MTYMITKCVNLLSDCAIFLFFFSFVDSFLTCLWRCFSVVMFYNYSDFDSLDEKDVEKNNQLAFDVAEKEFGISPIMTGKEMSGVVEPDKLSMVMYLSQFYEMFKDTVPPGGEL